MSTSFKAVGHELHQKVVCMYQTPFYKLGHIYTCIASYSCIMLPCLFVQSAVNVLLCVPNFRGNMIN